MRVPQNDETSRNPSRSGIPGILASGPFGRLPTYHDVRAFTREHGHLLHSHAPTAILAHGSSPPDKQADFSTRHPRIPDHTKVGDSDILLTPITEFCKRHWLHLKEGFVIGIENLQTETSRHAVNHGIRLDQMPVVVKSPNRDLVLFSKTKLGLIYRVTDKLE